MQERREFVQSMLDDLKEKDPVRHRQVLRDMINTMNDKIIKANKAKAAKTRTRVNTKARRKQRLKNR